MTQNYGRGICSIKQCGNPAFCRGWCSKHYNRWQRKGDPMVQGQPRYVGVEFDDLVDRSAGPDGCWPWLGAIAWDGYGRWRRNGTKGAHREAYRRAMGEPDPLLVLDHWCHQPSECKGGTTCPHRRCCNPLHLRLVPNLENLRRANTTAGYQKIFCKRGHPLSGENLYIAPKTGARACQECKRLWKATRRLSVSPSTPDP